MQTVIAATIFIWTLNSLGMNLNYFETGPSVRVFKLENVMCIYSLGLMSGWEGGGRVRLGGGGGELLEAALCHGGEGRV